MTESRHKNSFASEASTEPHETAPEAAVEATADEAGAAQLELLAACPTPLLIGIRHHSAALARVLPRLLSQSGARRILLELPPDFRPWISHLGDPETEAPVALAASVAGRLLSFYPFADFSPELVTIRWALKSGVELVLCDLDLASQTRLERGHADASQTRSDPASTEALARLRSRADAADSGRLWDQLVETPALTSSPEAIRRAGLLFGWLMRKAAGGPTVSDAHREAAMRAALQVAIEDAAPAVAVVGAFHAPALLPEPLLWTPPAPLPPLAPNALSDVPATSLVPYRFEQLDERSGYPAGVLDPAWQQAMLHSESVEDVQRRVREMAVALCRRLRAAGHVAGTPDATEIVRVAVDLSRLRGQPVPGRRELLEAVETVLVQGDLLGRGRAVAAAAQAVLVGTRHGRVTPAAPIAGLEREVAETLQRLKLPGPDTEPTKPRELRLDPLRSRRDRARCVVLRRLNLLGVKYAQRIDAEAVGMRINLTELWRLQWDHASAATLAGAATWGVTLRQACEVAVGMLTSGDNPVATHFPPADLSPARQLTRLEAAAECGLPELSGKLLEAIDARFLAAASAATLVQTAHLLQRIHRGQIVGLPRREEDPASPDVEAFVSPVPMESQVVALIEAAVRALEGIQGSDDVADVQMLTDLSGIVGGDQREAASPEPAGPLAPLLVPLQTQLRRLRTDGSPRMQGAATGALALLQSLDPRQLSPTLRSWCEASPTLADGNRILRSRLQGLLIPLAPLIRLEADWLQGLEQSLLRFSDADFLQRVPGLRGGFDALVPADRAELLQQQLQHVLQREQPAQASSASPVRRSTFGRPLLDDPVARAAALAADRVARAAVVELFSRSTEDRPASGSDSSAAALAPQHALLSDLPESGGLPAGDLKAQESAHDSESAGQQSGMFMSSCEIGLVDRWRLILGLQGPESTTARRTAAALDQLYGVSARPDTGYAEDLLCGPTSGGPSVREWVDDVQQLFGEDVCQQVLADAAAAGRPAVLEHLIPDIVRPSIGLLEQVLTLHGALPETQLAMLRRLARRITDRLASALADRLRPALQGLSTPRPSRRRTHRLDFRRTLRQNLQTAQRRPDGRLGLAPTRIVFRTPARRQLDWHLIFAVDVSGSMEASVIYSAMMAAIFSALPALEVTFYAFNTEIVDLSDVVDDPLSLLLEVRVGGGTQIGQALRAARQAIRNPSRSLIVLVTDFEEGVSVAEMLAEISTLSAAGARLLGLAALDDDARPRFHRGNAAAAAAAGMPVAAVSPERLAQWVSDQIRGDFR